MAWEYEFLRPELGGNFREDLRALGRDGWELVTIMPSATGAFTAYLKRPADLNPEASARLIFQHGWFCGRERGRNGTDEQERQDWAAHADKYSPPSRQPGREAVSVETPQSVAVWCEETFGPCISHASLAARANREMGELLQALAADDRHPKAAEECADVIICLWRLMVLAGADPQTEIDRKMAVNRARQWVLDGNGHGQHVPTPRGPPP